VDIQEVEMTMEAVAGQEVMMTIDKVEVTVVAVVETIAVTEEEVIIEALEEETVEVEEAMTPDLKFLTVLEVENKSNFNLIILNSV
jgi:hypothetical protein